VGLNSAAPAAPQSEARAGLGARRAATALLSGVLDRHKSLDLLLGTDDPLLTALAPRDRSLARAIVGTALRRYGEIGALLSRLIERPPSREHAGRLIRILEVATTQLLFLDVPDHAAVSLAMADITSDRQAVRFKALANAVLRRIARERNELLAAVAARPNAPEWLYDRWMRTYGPEAAARISAAHRVEPALDLTVKSDAAGWARRMGGFVVPTGTVRVAASGPVDQLPGYDEGAWWVQDAAAALPARLLGDVRGKRIADLCAAPGGKTAQLAAAGAEVVAVEIDAGRIARLSDTLSRLRLVAEIVQADVLDWQPEERFDAVLLDAPCTATGTIRRHPDIPFLKRPSDIPVLARLQTRMIDKAVALLRPGGTLVYATCSLEPEEGEAHVAPALARLPVTLVPVTGAELPGLPEALTPQGTVRTLPSYLRLADGGLSGLDGFFVMRLKSR
jgi:16S rRNA (cytosine967-C5)-methyltransferase